MKKMILSAILLLHIASCGSGLTEEQKRKIKEEMKTNTIKRVSEAEITEATFTKGRELSTQLQKTNNPDSLAAAHKVSIHWLEPGKSSAAEIENQLIEAYLSDPTSAAVDNVQKIGTDSLLYTLPVIEKGADGISVVKGIWSIHISRKQLVLDM